MDSQNRDAKIKLESCKTSALISREKNYVWFSLKDNLNCKTKMLNSSNSQFYLEWLLDSCKKLNNNESSDTREINNKKQKQTRKIS